MFQTCKSIFGRYEERWAGFVAICCRGSCFLVCWFLAVSFAACSFKYVVSYVSGPSLVAIPRWEKLFFAKFNEPRLPSLSIEIFPGPPLRTPTAEPHTPRGPTNLLFQCTASITNIPIEVVSNINFMITAVVPRALLLNERKSPAKNDLDICKNDSGEIFPNQGPRVPRCNYNVGTVSVVLPTSYWNIAWSSLAQCHPAPMSYLLVSMLATKERETLTK